MRISPKVTLLMSRVAEVMIALVAILIDMIDFRLETVNSFSPDVFGFQEFAN
jgi:hypothetical protein